MGNLAIISRDRYLAVRKPWWYRNHATRLRVVKQVSLVWIFSAILGLIKYAKFVFPAFVFPFYFICICCIIYSYVGIFIGNRRQRVAVQQHGIQIQETLRREIGKNSWFDPVSSLFYFLTSGYFSLNFCNAGVLSVGV